MFCKSEYQGSGINGASERYLEPSDSVDLKLKNKNYSKLTVQAAD